MNIDKILKIFVPKDHSFFPLFESDARNLVKASELLKELFDTTDIEEHERIFKEIRDVEHIGDDITIKTYEQLNKSFITPFDREDIHELTANIDDVVDSINGIARRICLYSPKKMMPIYKEMAQLVYEGAKELETAIYCLKDPVANKEKITSCLRQLSLLLNIKQMSYISREYLSFLKKKKIQRSLSRITRSSRSSKDALMRRKMLRIR